jgi:hypothetical protein
VKGKGYGSFFVATFNLQMSTHIQGLPFFFNTTTIGDNQVASSTNAINPTTNNLSKSYLTIAT